MTSTFDRIDRQLDLLYREVREINPHLPTRLFHFTDSQGCIGIFVNQTLWASNADFLNDASEPEYALGVLKEVAEQTISRLPAGTASRALENFWPWLVRQRQQQGPHLYVFCLSEHDDLLSQWRAYGGYGAGYAIGFNSGELCKLLERAEGQYLVKIAYDRHEQEAEAKSVFGKIIRVVDEFEKSDLPLTRARLGGEADLIDEKIRTAFLSEIIRLRARFKDAAFREEGEWRVVQFLHPGMSDPQVRFRSSANAIVPYVELQLGNLPIE